MSLSANFAIALALAGLGAETMEWSFGDPGRAAPTEARRPATAPDDEPVNDSVIGRPFPVSESVWAICDENLAVTRGAPCGAVIRLLSAMTEEPRDPAWAWDTEAKLREFVEAAAQTFVIRNVECRTSLCAVEVASTHGHFPFARVGDSGPLDGKVWAWKGWFGFETDASGNKVIVTLFVVERR